MYKYQTAFDLDLSGNNPDNLVKLEPHQLNLKKQVKAFVPFNGLFYANSIIIYDGTEPLLPNVDYMCVEQHQELTAKTGQGVYSGVVIFKRNVKANIKVTYQVVGGPYVNDNKAIANVYESILNDSRLVHWNNISGKPHEFPPGDHYHPINDLVNWTPIIHQIERLVMVLGLNTVDLVEKIIKSLLGGFACRQLEKNFPSSNIVQYDAFLHALSERKLLSNVSVRSTLCKWSPGRMAHFDIDTSQFPIGHKFYWRFYKEENLDINIKVEQSGLVEGNGDTVRVYIYVPGNHIDEEEVLYVGVNSKPFKDDFEAVSYKILFTQPLFASTTYGLMASIRRTESDETTSPMLFNSSPYTRLKYLLDHVSAFKYSIL